jgi:hypothetical protein
VRPLVAVQGVLTSHKVGYIHDSWSINNNVEFEICVQVNGSCCGLSD